MRRGWWRIALVLVGTALTAVLVAFVTDPTRGMGVGFLLLAVWTLLTIPDDLQPGEYDLFGLGVLAIMLIVGLLALALKPEGPRYYKGHDPPESQAWPD